MDDKTETAQPGATGDELITTIELSVRLKVSVGTVQNWMRAGLVPYIKLPGTKTVRFNWPDVMRKLSRQSLAA
jgi:excisionase family DNA binding protein